MSNTEEDYRKYITALKNWRADLNKNMMKELVNTTDKMTSLVIAEITGKPHNDVMKSIRKMEDAWVGLGQGNFSLISYVDSQNRAKPMYELSKAECLYIATKFNDEAWARLVLRFHL